MEIQSVIFVVWAWTCISCFSHNWFDLQLLVFVILWICWVGV